VDPFELHPEVLIKPGKEKKDLTFEKISSIIENKIAEVRGKQTPRWGYTSRDMVALLKSVKTEMGKECR